MAPQRRRKHSSGATDLVLQQLTLPPDAGDVVLAEKIQTFHEGDVISFRPFSRQAALALTQCPTHRAVDAAPDAPPVLPGPLALTFNALVGGQTCDHEQFLKGKGYQKDSHDEPGGRAHVLMDRTGPLSHAVSIQRTACERIYSQAKELGIERPRVHNGQSVPNLNTLVYVTSALPVAPRTSCSVYLRVVRGNASGG